MVNQKPRASVIIPTYNSAKTIVFCLKSLLEQDYENLEIIVVDDCSTDDTVKLVSGFPRIKLIANPKNGGPSYARNNGVRNSEGEIIILLDSDSYIKDKTWARRHVEAHLKNKECIIGGGIKGEGKGIIAKAEKYFWVTNIPHSGTDRPFAYTHLVTNNLSFPRHVFYKIGGFEESIHSGEDVLFCHQANKLSIKLLLLSDIIIYHRDRESFRDIMARGLKYGEDRLFLKKQGAYKYGFLIPSNSFLGFLFSPLIAFLGTVRFIVGWWHWDKLVLIYSPILFIANLFMAIGIAKGALKKRL